MAQPRITTAERVLAHTHRAAEVRAHNKLIGLVEQARPRSWFRATALRSDRGLARPRPQDLGKFRTLEEALAAIRAPSGRRA